MSTDTRYDVIARTLLAVNEHMQGPFVPPTAIGWIAQWVDEAIASADRHNQDQNHNQTPVEP